MAGILEAEGVALDIGAYRSAPPGFRVWCATLTLIRTRTLTRSGTRTRTRTRPNPNANPNTNPNPNPNPNPNQVWPHRRVVRRREARAVDAVGARRGQGVGLSLSSFGSVHGHFVDQP